MAAYAESDEVINYNAYVTVVRAVGLHPKLSEHNACSLLLHSLVVSCYIPWCFLLWLLVSLLLPQPTRTHIVLQLSFPAYLAHTLSRVFSHPLCHILCTSPYHEAVHDSSIAQHGLY
jgi:hypothetical protein